MATRFKIAEASDAALLLDLMREFYEYDRIQFDLDVAREALLGLLGDQSRGRAWVVFVDGETAGYVVLSLGYSLEYGGPNAILDELFLREPYRGRGLGREALEVVELACGELGARALHLVVGRENIKAQAFYRRSGFLTEDRFLMTKRIIPGKGSGEASQNN